MLPAGSCKLEKQLRRHVILNASCSMLLFMIICSNTCPNIDLLKDSVIETHWQGILVRGETHPPNQSEREKDNNKEEKIIGSLFISKTIYKTCIISYT